MPIPSHLSRLFACQSAGPAARPWTVRSAVFAGLTGAFLAAIALSAACGPLVTNGSKRHDPPARQAFQTNRSSGDSASSLLSGADFKSVVVEVQAIRGFGPTPEALNRFKRFLETRLDKPEGITILPTVELPSSAAATTYTASEARALESKYRTRRPSGSELALYLLFLDGASADTSADASADKDHKLLGEAYANLSIMIFEGALRAAAATHASVWLAETALLEHELGHLAGLVSNPLPAQSAHEDSSHPGHCHEPKCLMAAGGDTTDLIDRLSGGFPELDEACLKDLRAAGGR